jgi:hypothetical protein
MHAAMNAAPLKRTLSVTGLLLTGAGCGVIAIKVVAPTFLSPATAAAQALPHFTTGGRADASSPPPARATGGYHIPLTPKVLAPTTAPESAFSLPATKPVGKGT